jgi:integrase/recombinase XerD
MAIIEDFDRDMSIRGMTPASRKTYLSAIQDFQQATGREPQDAARQDVRAYIEDLRSRGCSTSTVALRLAALSSFFDFLIYEEIAQANPVLAVRKRYLAAYKTDSETHTHQIITTDELVDLVLAVVDIRDKALIILFAKTGIRRKEMVSLDVSDIDWKDWSITLKETKKRSNRLVFFDEEAAAYLGRWLKVREIRAKPGETALWIATGGGRLKESGITKVVKKAALRTGLHDRGSDDMEDHFSPHCFRHWWTTELLKAGMRREEVKELRGDVRREAIDIYDHIDKDELRRSYMAHIPQLGV